MTNLLVCLIIVALMTWIAWDCWRNYRKARLEARRNRLALVYQLELQRQAMEEIENDPFYQPPSPKEEGT